MSGIRWRLFVIDWKNYSNRRSHCWSLRNKAMLCIWLPEYSECVAWRKSNRISANSLIHKCWCDPIFYRESPNLSVNALSLKFRLANPSQSRRSCFNLWRWVHSLKLLSVVCQLSPLTCRCWANSKPVILSQPKSINFVNNGWNSQDD